jgi:restriction endonuclease S subunit
LEGLEMSIQSYKDLESIIDYRIEAEYFDKRFIAIDEIFNRRKHVIFFDVADYENGRAYSSDDFFEGIGGIKVARIGDVTQKKPNANWISVTDEEFKKQNGNYLVHYDILMTLTGDPPDVGKVNLFIENNIKSTWNQRVARIYLRKEQDIFINQKVFYAILSTRYCREQLERYAKGIRQRNLGIECIERLKLPIIENSVQLHVSDLIELSFMKYEQSQEFYRQAEELLLETIGLKDFQPSQTGTNIKSFSESFLTTGRLDAEYYQPKYEDYVQLIKNYPNGFDLLQNVCNLKDSNFNPEETKEYQYIELSDIGKAGNITGCTFAQGKELPSRARRKINSSDVIISSIEGSLESCALVTEDYDNAMCSTGFYVINSDRINSETLLVLFKSEVMQNVLKQNCSGTILTAINKTEFLQITVPLINKEIQCQIAELIGKSLYFRGESERLLNDAKDMVEKEIENENVEY